MENEVTEKVETISSVTTTDIPDDNKGRVYAQAEVFYDPINRRIPLGRVVLQDFLNMRKHEQGSEAAQYWLCIVIEANPRASDILESTLKLKVANGLINLHLGSCKKMWVNVKDIPKSVLKLDPQINMPLHGKNVTEAKGKKAKPEKKAKDVKAKNEALAKKNNDGGAGRLMFEKKTTKAKRRGGKK